MNCDNVRSPGSFWKVIKPFMSNNCSSQHGSITLYENDKIVNNDAEVCEIFNNHFSSCASTIGSSAPLVSSDTIEDIVKSFEDHASIKAIKSNSPLCNDNVLFDFE